MSTISGICVFHVPGDEFIVQISVNIHNSFVTFDSQMQRTTVEHLRSTQVEAMTQVLRWVWQS